MTGVLHEHEKGIPVYHRRDGALIYHGVHHSRHIPALDRKRKAKYAPPNPNYPMAGDGQPIHTGTHGHMKARAISGGGKRKDGTVPRKPRKSKGRRK